MQKVTFILKVDGQPEKSIKLGESYQVPMGTVHDAKTGGGSLAARWQRIHLDPRRIGPGVNVVYCWRAHPMAA